jgi:hypothetical protein
MLVGSWSRACLIVFFGETNLGGLSGLTLAGVVGSERSDGSEAPDDHQFEMLPTLGFAVFHLSMAAAAQLLDSLETVAAASLAAAFVLIFAAQEGSIAASGLSPTSSATMRA